MKNLKLLTGSLLLLAVLLGLSAAAWAEADPLSVAVGARSLGMGGVCLSLSANPLGAAANPAGLADLSAFTFSSLYGRLMNITNYLVLALVEPTEAGTFAFTYLRSGIDDVLWPVTVGGGHRPDTLTSVAYIDSQYVLSYAHSLEIGQLGRVAGGLNWKFLNQLVGPASASGMEADLGLIYSPVDWLSFGLAAKNFLPSSLGYYDWNGTKQGIPPTASGGANVRFFNGRLLFGGDIDIKTLPGYQRRYRFGGEGWVLEDLLCLRAGLDQSQAVSGKQNNLTLGLGLKLGDLTIDYAYHTYYNEPGWATHYVSLTERLPF